MPTQRITSATQINPPPPTGTGVSSIGVQDEGASQGNATIFNFVGSNVDASVSGTVARIFVTGSFDVPFSTGNVSNPPTQAELETLLGSPIGLKVGTTYYLNDALNYDREYMAIADGFYWWILPLVKTAYTEPTSASASNATGSLNIPTYDGSNQCVHPDVIDMGAGNTWNGHRYWMAMTPYPASDADYENPSIVVSEDGNSWSVPAGLTNPVVAGGVGFHNADPDIVLSPSGEMWMLYLKTNGSTYDEIFAKSSSDGVNWGSPILIISGSFGDFLSPSIIYDGTQYIMWHVNDTDNPNTLKRRICSSPSGTWSGEVTCTLNNMPGGKDIWHVNVVKRGQVYHGFFTMCTSGTNGSGSILYFATSPDGLAWTISNSPLLSISGGWDNNLLYRSSGIPTPSGYDLFYSAMTTAGNVWHIGRTQVTLS